MQERLKQSKEEPAAAEDKPLSLVVTEEPAQEDPQSEEEPEAEEQEDEEDGGEYTNFEELD